MEKIGAIIKSKRKENNISLKGLAQKVDVSASFLSQVECDKVFPSLQTLKKISVALNYSIGELIGEERSKKNTQVLKVNERRVLQEIGTGVELQFLSSLDRNHILEPCIE